MKKARFAELQIMGGRCARRLAVPRVWDEQRYAVKMASAVRQN